MFYNFDDIIWTPAAPRAAKEPCVRLRSTELYQLLEFQGLINLEVQVGFDAFSIPIQQGIFPWRHDFDAREVDQLWISQVIRNECPTLRQIRILDGGRMPAMTEAELATWKSNLAQLGAILQLRIELQSRLPKQAVTVPDSPEPTPVRVCNHDIKPRHSLRADSLYDTGLPLYAPESQVRLGGSHPLSLDMWQRR